jgi:hypothetical protein
MRDPDAVLRELGRLYDFQKQLAKFRFTGSPKPSKDTAPDPSPQTPPPPRQAPEAQGGSRPA